MFSSDMRNWYSVLLGSLVACGVGVADAFHFHSFGTNADLILFMGGLTALGLHISAVTATNVAVNTVNNPPKQ